MPYPTDDPTSKHDLVGPKLQSGDGGEPHLGKMIPSTAELFQELEHGTAPKVVKHSSVYTYPDGPKIPGPLSRALIMIGFADTSLSLVRKLLAGDDVPSCFHKCTIGVKRADSSYRSRLDPKNLENSKQFAKLMKLLRKESAVVITGLDKHGRFAIIGPMEEENFSSEDFSAEDFSAVCYVGNVKEVKEFLANRVSTEHPKPAEASESTGEMWQPPGAEEGVDGSSSLWQPPGGDEPSSAGLWQPPGNSDFNGSGGAEGEGFDSWQPPPTEASTGQKRKRSDADEEDNTFHTDTGAAAADKFYSGLTRTLDTRADSRLYHMRAFNGWVKATQIAELDPRTISKGRTKQGGPLRILDLACGKGGDLGKWVLHKRGIGNYVGVDVARGSLTDAAVRARKMRNKLKRCTFTCADLGYDVPGRLRSPKHKQMQKLLTWSMQGESDYESGTPNFQYERGGGISADEKFDVVSIQFAIHYMMSTRKRARRFFHTVSQLLEVGGNLVATTIDARIVIQKMMNLGLDLFNISKNEKIVVGAGAGACRIQFEPHIVEKIFSGKASDDDMFGLEYTFTLVEGSDHASGVGDAVNLPEWLTPIPALSQLASEAGLELEYAQNFHEFFATRQDPAAFPNAHNALYNMKVLNRNGSISEDEWGISRLYAAIKFRKVRESEVTLDDDSDKEEEVEEEAKNPPVDTAKRQKMLPMAMMKAKKTVGSEQWQALDSDEKKRLIEVELDKMC